MPKLLENRVALVPGGGSGMERAIAVGRLGRSDEVTQMVLRLSSGEMSFVTGAYHAANAGYLAP
jgi:hypothetical protein